MAIEPSSVLTTQGLWLLAGPVVDTVSASQAAIAHTAREGIPDSAIVALSALIRMARTAACPDEKCDTHVRHTPRCAGCANSRSSSAYARFSPRVPKRVTSSSQASSMSRNESLRATHTSGLNQNRQQTQVKMSLKRGSCLRIWESSCSIAWRFAWWP